VTRLEISARFAPAGTFIRPMIFSDEGRSVFRSFNTASGEQKSPRNLRQAFPRKTSSLKSAAKLRGGAVEQGDDQQRK